MSNRIRPTTARGAILAALAVVLGLAATPSAEGQVACRITSADALVFSDTPQGDAVTYYAQVIMYTDECGVSPAEVQATFRPVTGVASTCDFRGTLLSDYALCQGGAGVAAPGTQVVVDAVGRTYGTGGADVFASSCTLIVAPLPPPTEGVVPLGSSASRGTCPLPLQ